MLAIFTPRFYCFTRLLWGWLALSVWLCNANAQDIHHDTEHEQPLLQAFSAVQSGDLDGALSTVESLVKKTPEFKLAQLVYADLLFSKAQSSAALGLSSGPNTEGVADLLAEARVRWHHRTLDHDAQLIPAFLVELPADQPTALVVDTQSSRLYVFENHQGTPMMVGDFYVTIGKNGIEKQSEGDKRTPLGVYYVTSHLAAGSLPPYYGIGAFPLNYPNEWDLHLGKTGSGIWLHGNPLNAYSRAPQASDGCVTLSNQDFKELQPFIHIGKTPVIIASQVPWVPAETLAKARADLYQQLQTWARDWSSRNSDHYLAHYAQDFFSPDRNFRQWQEYKREVNANKKYIDVKVDHIGMLLYPNPSGSTPLMMIEFEQQYRSDQLSARSPKRQWWRQEPNGLWKIVYEGPA